MDVGYFYIFTQSLMIFISYYSWTPDVVIWLKAKSRRY